jgi:hypothetical protein
MGIRLFTSIGNNVPPIEEPAATYPIANPRRFLNQWAMIAVVGLKIPPHPSCLRKIFRIRGRINV